MIFNEKSLRIYDFQQKIHKVIVFEQKNKNKSQKSQNFKEQTSKINDFQSETTKNTQNAMVFHQKCIKNTVVNENHNKINGCSINR